MAKLQKQIEAAVRRRAKQGRPQAAETVKLEVTWGQRDAFTQSHATVLLAVELPGLCRELCAPRPWLGVAPAHLLANVEVLRGQGADRWLVPSDVLVRCRSGRPPATTGAVSDEP